jgi:hypothetical protein
MHLSWGRRRRQPAQSANPMGRFKASFADDGLDLIHRMPLGEAGEPTSESNGAGRPPPSGECWAIDPAGSAGCAGARGPVTFAPQGAARATALCAPVRIGSALGRWL